MAKTQINPKDVSKVSGLNKLSIDQKIEAVDTNKRLNKLVEKRYAKIDSKIEKAKGNELKLKKIDKKYGYNYESAISSGIKPDSTGHWASIGDDGLILKAKKHPSMIKTRKVERILGNKIVKEKGNLYSVPKNKNNGKD